MAQYSAGEARVRLVPDASRFLAETRTKLAAIRDPGFNVHVGADTDPAKRDLTEMRAEESKRSVKQSVDADTGKATTQITVWRRKEEANDVNVKVNVDTATARAQIAALRRPVNEFSNSLTSFGNNPFTKTLSLAVYQLPLFAAGLGEAAASMQQLAQAALIVPGGITAAVASIGTLAFGIGGVKQAWDDAGAASLTSGKDQAQSAQQAISASNALRNAIVDEGRARKDVGQAIRDARNDLRDLNVEMRGGLISESRAILEAQKAREDFASGNYSDIRDAKLRVLEADQRLLEVRSRNTESAQKLNDAESKGVSGSDKVANANENLIRALQQTASAQAAATAALSSGGAAADKAAASMAKLSPNARDFVQAMIGLKDGPIKDLREFNQQKIFAGLADDATKAFATLAPTLAKGTGAISDAWNKTFKTLFTTIGTDQNKTLLDRILGNTAEAQNRLTGVIDPLVTGVGTLAAAGTDALPRVADALTSVADRFADFITEADRNGSLKKWIDDGLTAFGHLSNAALNVTRIFTGITQAANGDWLQKIDQFTTKWADFLNSPEGQQKLHDIFDEGRRELDQWKPILEALPGLFQGLLNGAETYVKPLIEILKPITEFLSSQPKLVEGAVAAWLGWATVIGTINTFKGAIIGLTGAMGTAGAAGAAATGGAAAGGAGLLGPLAAAAAIAVVLNKVFDVNSGDFTPGKADALHILFGDAGDKFRDLFLGGPKSAHPGPLPVPGQPPNPLDQFPVVPAGPPGPPPPGKRVDEFKFGDPLPDGYVWDIPTKSIRRTSDNQLLLPDVMIPGKQTGGGIPGYGGGDKIPILVEGGEHIFDKDDVRAMGGQQAVTTFRQHLHGYQSGGAVTVDENGNPVGPGPVGPAPGGAQGTLPSIVGQAVSGAQRPIGMGISLASDLIQQGIAQAGKQADTNAVIDQIGPAIGGFQTGGPIDPVQWLQENLGGGGKFNPNITLDPGRVRGQRPVDNLLQPVQGNYKPSVDYADYMGWVEDATGWRRLQDLRQSMRSHPPGFQTGGPVVNPFQNPVLGPAPGPPAPDVPAAPDAAAPAPGGGLLGSFLGGLGIPGLGGSGGGGGGGTSLKGAAAIPGLFGLAAIAGQPGDQSGSLMAWGTQTAQWLGQFTANFGMKFGTTLLQGVTSGLGIDTTYLQDAQKVAAHFGGLLGDVTSGGGQDGDIVDPASLAPGYGVDYGQITSHATAGTPADASGSGSGQVPDWDATARGESGGEWNKVFGTGVPEGGGLQIKPGTWEMYGGKQFADKPYQATKAQQITIAERILNGWNGVPGQGAKAWEAWGGYKTGAPAPGIGASAGAGGVPVLSPGNFDAIDTIASQRFGLTMTSGFRDPNGPTVAGVPANKSYHGSGRAHDYSGTPENMLAFANYMAATFGPQLKEEIFSAPGFSSTINNGKVVGPFGAFYTLAQAGDHSDHVHIAYSKGGPVNRLDRGGFLAPGLSTVYNGLGHPEPVIPLNPADVPGFQVGGPITPELMAAQIKTAAAAQPVGPVRGPEARTIQPQPAPTPRPTPAPTPQPVPAQPIQPTAPTAPGGAPSIPAGPAPAAPPPPEFPIPGTPAPPPPGPTAPARDDVTASHNLAWINKGIESGASALGTALATAMGVGGGFVPGLGAAAPYAAGLVQQGGKIVEDAANVVSSFLIGNVPGSGTTTASASGEMLRPAQRQLATAAGNGNSRVASYGPFYGHDTRSVMQEINLHEAMEEQTAFSNRGMRG